VETIIIGPKGKTSGHYSIRKARRMRCTGERCSVDVIYAAIYGTPGARKKILEHQRDTMFKEGERDA